MSGCCRGTIPHVDDVHFSYRLTGVGWAEADLRIGDQSARLTASYVGDALGELLRGTLALARGTAQVEVSWAQEPGEFKWVLVARHDASVDVQILRLRLRPEEASPGEPADPGRQVLTARCGTAEFCRAIARGARAALEEYGFDGYRERWDQFDFPSETLSTLLALG